MFAVLDASGDGLGTPAIAERTGLPERTVRYAVRWLEDRRIVERTVRLSDARRQVVRVRSRPTWALSDREHAAWFRGH